MRRFCRLVYTSLLVAGIAISSVGCGNQESVVSTEESSIMVDVMPVEKGTLTLKNQFVGLIAPKESVYVIPMAQGTVTDTYFEMGDTVEAGELLFEIDDTAAQLQLKQAQLTYNNTKTQVDSSWDNATTQKQSSIDQLKAQKTAALAQLQGAQTQYFTLVDSINEGTQGLDSLKEQYEKIDTMSSDEVIKLAETMLGSMLSSSTGTGSMNISSILGKLSGNTNADSEIAKEEKDKLAAELRPMLKEQLQSQIQQIESSLAQAQMSLNMAYTSMSAAEESYNLLEESIKTAENTSLEDTKKQLDNSLNLAKLGVDSAKLALSYYDVTSPISGTIISKGVEVNGFATSSQPAYVIANNDSMTVTFSVSEAIKNTLVPGAGISVERNGVVFEGVITEVGNAVNQQTGLFQVKGTVYANGEELPSGVSVKLTAETYRAEDAVIILYDAVYYTNEGAYVYVMKDDLAVKTMVTTGIFDDTNIEITSGLSEGDMVITSWSPRLIDGAMVESKKLEN